MLVLILCLIIISIIFLLIKLTLYFLVKKYGKFSYDGFNAAGFKYDAKNDIFYSTKNAWQKNFGYTHLYDVLAPLFMMIVDTQPVKFYYNNKNWLISFWKGQYGIVTGAEVGVYCTDEKEVNKKNIYFPVDDDEILDIYLVLYKNKKIIATSHAKHWWLTIFKLGMFSNPKDLMMDINITFRDYQMLRSFLEAFNKLVYTSKDYMIINNTFYFRYTKPCTRKVWTRMWLIDKIRQFFNHKNVELYNKHLLKFIENNKIDDSKTKESKNLIMINDLIPDLLKNQEIHNEQSKKIINNIYNESENNLVFLGSNINSKTRVDNHE